MFIKNRNGKKISVDVKADGNSRLLAFIVHGLGGHRKQKHLISFSKVLQKQGYAVVSFDARNSVGESEGEFEKGNVTEWIRDLEDVIKWSKQQNFYKEPFLLLGHSLGGMAVNIYASNNPKMVKGVIAISPIISPKLHEKSLGNLLEVYRKTGWMILKDEKGIERKVEWKQFEDDVKKYDLLKISFLINMPILLIVGEKDTRTPKEHQKLFFESIPGKKEFHIIKDVPHTAITKDHIIMMNNIIEKWLKEI